MPKSYRISMHLKIVLSCELVPLDPAVARPLALCLHSVFAGLGHGEIGSVRVSAPCVRLRAVFLTYSEGCQTATSPSHHVPRLVCGLREADICELSMASLVCTEYDDLSLVEAVIHSEVDPQ